MPVLGIVVGLEAEARVARRLGAVAVGGGSSSGAEAAAEGLVAGGATALVSFGLAGGLDPRLRAGDIVVPSAVLEAGFVYPVEPALAAALGGMDRATVLAGTEVLADVAAKHAAWDATGAAIVDLESGAVARVAGRHGMPFAVLRAVCDPAGRTLPAAALLALSDAGVIGVARVIASLLSRPGQISALLALVRDAHRARAALVRRVAEVGREADSLTGDSSPP